MLDRNINSALKRDGTRAERLLNEKLKGHSKTNRRGRRAKSTSEEENRFRGVGRKSREGPFRIEAAEYAARMSRIDGEPELSGLVLAVPWRRSPRKSRLFGRGKRF